MAKGKKRATKEATATLLSKVVHQELVYKDSAYNQGVFKYLRLLVHFLAALQFCYGVYFHQFKVQWPTSNDGGVEEEFPKSENQHWGGKFKFLTFLNAILQAGYHSVALLNDLFGSNEVSSKTKEPVVRKLRDYIFAALAFPLAGNVCISFWFIYAIDRELVFPAVLDAIFPNWLNHIVHTNVAMMIILDMFTCFRRYPSRARGLAGASIFMVLYLVWIHIVKHFSGQWVYPLLEVLNMPMRYVVMAALSSFTVLLYFVGEWLNGVVWGQEFKLLQREQFKVQ